MREIFNTQDNRQILRIVIGSQTAFRIRLAFRRVTVRGGTVWGQGACSGEMVRSVFRTVGSGKWAVMGIKTGGVRFKSPARLCDEFAPF